MLMPSSAKRPVFALPPPTKPLALNSRSSALEVAWKFRLIRLHVWEPKPLKVIVGADWVTPAKVTFQ